MSVQLIFTITSPLIGYPVGALLGTVARNATRQRKPVAGRLSLMLAILALLALYAKAQKRFNWMDPRDPEGLGTTSTEVALARIEGLLLTVTAFTLTVGIIRGYLARKQRVL